MKQFKNQQPAIFDLWESGELRAKEALESLVNQLDRLEDRLDPMEAAKQAIRGQISLIVERDYQGKAELPGIGVLQNTSAVVTAVYDRAKLDALIASLTAEGHTDIAQRIAACRKESYRSGSLRITRSKEI